MELFCAGDISLERKSQTCAFVIRASEQISTLLQTAGLCCTAVWVIFLEYPFPGKVGSDLGEEKPITSIRLTTQFVRVRRISDLYNPTYSKKLLEINRSRNAVRVEGRCHLN